MPKNWSYVDPQRICLFLSLFYPFLYSRSQVHLLKSSFDRSLRAAFLFNSSANKTTMTPLPDNWATLSHTNQLRPRPSSSRNIYSVALNATLQNVSQTSRGDVIDRKITAPLVRKDQRTVCCAGQERVVRMVAGLKGDGFPPVNRQNTLVAVARVSVLPMVITRPNRIDDFLTSMRWIKDVAWPSKDFLSSSYTSQH